MPAITLWITAGSIVRPLYTFKDHEAQWKNTQRLHTHVQHSQFIQYTVHTLDWDWLYACMLRRSPLCSIAGRLKTRTRSQNRKLDRAGGYSWFIDTSEIKSALSIKKFTIVDWRNFIKKFQNYIFESLDIIV